MLCTCWKQTDDKELREEAAVDPMGVLQQIMEELNLDANFTGIEGDTPGQCDRLQFSSFLHLLLCVFWFMYTCIYQYSHTRRWQQCEQVETVNDAATKCMVNTIMLLYAPCSAYSCYFYFITLMVPLRNS